jgi:hypothetical protein
LERQQRSITDAIDEKKISRRLAAILVAISAIYPASAIANMQFPKGAWSGWLDYAVQAPYYGITYYLGIVAFFLNFAIFFFCFDKEGARLRRWSTIVGLILLAGVVLWILAILAAQPPFTL